jgi:hypothetical protein
VVAQLGLVDLTVDPPGFDPPFTTAAGITFLLSGTLSSVSPLPVSTPIPIDSTTLQTPAVDIFDATLTNLVLQAVVARGSPPAWNGRRFRRLFGWWPRLYGLLLGFNCSSPAPTCPLSAIHYSTGYCARARAEAPLDTSADRSNDPVVTRPEAGFSKVRQVAPLPAERS